MEWLLHIGITKTGSKAIQRFLASEAAGLDDPRILYVRSGRSGTWHEEVFYSVQNGCAHLLADAKREAQSARADYAVLSYEGFHALPTERIQLVRDTLGDARIVLFIRRQDDHVNSWYNQLIKAHRVPFSEIESFERSTPVYDAALDYAAIIERWGSVFGHNALHILIYEKARCSVRALLDVMRVPRSVLDGRTDNANPALTAELAAMLRGIKQMLGDRPELPQVVEAFHLEYGATFVDSYARAPVYLLGSATCQAIMNQYVASNETVRRRWFPERETLFGALPPGSYASLDLVRGVESAVRFLRQHFPASLPR